MYSLLLWGWISPRLDYINRQANQRGNQQYDDPPKFGVDILLPFVDGVHSLITCLDTALYGSHSCCKPRLSIAKINILPNL
jgi:hypothetical protein